MPTSVSPGTSLLWWCERSTNYRVERRPTSSCLPAAASSSYSGSARNDSAASGQMTGHDRRPGPIDLLGASGGEHPDALCWSGVSCAAVQRSLLRSGCVHTENSIRASPINCRRASRADRTSGLLRFHLRRRAKGGTPLRGEHMAEDGGMAVPVAQVAAASSDNRNRREE